MTKAIRDLAHEAVFVLQFDTEKAVQYVKHHEPSASETDIKAEIYRVASGK